MQKTLLQVKKEFIADTLKRPANKSANKVILNLIDLINNDSAKITADNSKGGNIASRGVVAECLIKLFYKQTKSAKWSPSGSDMTLNGEKWEIKCSTSKGYAHYNPSQKINNLIFVNQYGIFETRNGQDVIILDKCGKHIQSIKITKDVKQVVAF